MGKSTISTGPLSIAFCMFTRPGTPCRIAPRIAPSDVPATQAEPVKAVQLAADAEIYFQREQERFFVVAEARRGAGGQKVDGNDMYNVGPR